jgi:replication factor A1
LTPRIGLFEEKRGRPSGRFPVHYNYVKSLVLLARKHDLESTLLADAFFEAWENEISTCGSLEISCREVNHGSATFLIMKEERVVWQSSIKLETIRSPDIKYYLEQIPLPANAKKKKYHKDQKISELRNGMKGINVTAKIIEIPPTRTVNTRFGTLANVSNMMIADDTGSVRLSLWNNQIDKVHKGDEVEVSTCKVGRFRGELQLRLGRKGTISTINPPQQEELINLSILR